MKEGIFVGLQIKQLFEEKHFSTKLSSTGGTAWKAFGNICKNVLDNEKSESYSEIVQELLSSYSAMVFHMSLKLHFLHSH
jgi:hypothetical protein